MKMGPILRHPAERHVYQLLNHATSLRRQAAEAMSRGELDEASALLDDTELLASDVKELTDDIEERQVNDLLIHIQQALAEGDPIGEPTKPNGRLRGPSGAFMRIGAGLGVGLAIGGVLVDL